MIPEIPRWAWLWAICLPVVAGGVNAIALMALHHGGVTHLTGVSTEGAIGLGTSHTNLWMHAAMIIGLYALGCAISGWVSRSPRWIPTRAAGLMLAAESGLIAIAAGMGSVHLSAALGLCAVAMGIQNGLTSVVSGALLRTSHLTGMFTDLGIAVGQRLGRSAFDGRRVIVCVVVIGGFSGGGAIASASFQRFGFDALFASALLSALVAVVTFFLGQIRLTRFAR
ncbi:YoaK family protein [Luteibacter aegosomatissinici]|uniref:YoaK family protein n=1 Tax=Luteibacter aegosomatissinici TaxID=2911539 RepID=UPI001FF93A62|nr:YoaK family protein [Luteibacter aegosomatissinici]UPG92768.1 DUF1275 domain-containing protein [Luteibacter aegosomatissinici]